MKSKTALPEASVSYLITLLQKYTLLFRSIRYFRKATPLNKLCLLLSIISLG